MLTLTERYNQIEESVINGQFRQAIEQAEELDGYEKADFLEYLYIRDPKLVKRFCQAYFRKNAR